MIKWYHIFKPIIKRHGTTITQTWTLLLYIGKDVSRLSYKNTHSIRKKTWMDWRYPLYTLAIKECQSLHPYIHIQLRQHSLCFQIQRTIQSEYSEMDCQLIRHYRNHWELVIGAKPLGLFGSSFCWRWHCKAIATGKGFTLQLHILCWENGQIQSYRRVPWAKKYWLAKPEIYTTEQDCYKGSPLLCLVPKSYTPLGCIFLVYPLSEITKRKGSLHYSN